jgi:hypothetical protein
MPWIISILARLGLVLLGLILVLVIPDSAGRQLYRHLTNHGPICIFCGNPAVQSVTYHDDAKSVRTRFYGHNPQPTVGAIDFCKRHAPPRELHRNVGIRYFSPAIACSLFLLGAVLFGVGKWKGYDDDELGNVSGGVCLMYAVGLGFTYFDHLMLRLLTLTS